MFLNFVLSGKPSSFPQIVAVELKMKVPDSDPADDFPSNYRDFQSRQCVSGCCSEEIKINWVTCMSS